MLEKETDKINTCCCTFNSSWNNIPRVISTNFSSAFGSLFLSGWNFLLSRLYAFLMSASDAERCTVNRTGASTSKYYIYGPHMGSVAYSRGFCSSPHRRKRKRCRRGRKRTCTVVLRAFPRTRRASPEGQFRGREQGGSPPRRTNNGTPGLGCGQFLAKRM